MTESKAQLMDRLRAEGRWDEFKSRREGLKRGGMSAQAAWQTATSEFPPEPAPDYRLPPVDESQVPDDWFDLPQDGLANLICEATLWAAANLGRERVQPDMAPNALAWNLLVECHVSPDMKRELIRILLSRAMPLPGTIDKQAADDRHDAARDAELEERLAQIGKGHERLPVV